MQDVETSWELTIYVRLRSQQVTDWSFNLDLPNSKMFTLYEYPAFHDEVQKI